MAASSINHLRLSSDPVSAPNLIDVYFAGYPEARALYDTVADLLDAIGTHELRPGKSQVAFVRRHPYAAVWRPAQYLRHGAPLVLTIYLRERDPSPRWKEVAEPAPGRFTHHLELRGREDVDDEVTAWLRQAWSEAG